MEPNQPFDQAIVRKKFTRNDFDANEDVVISISHHDTENLLPGTYSYEIKIMTIKNGKEYIETIVPKRKFFILE